MYVVYPHRASKKVTINKLQPLTNKIFLHFNIINRPITNALTKLEELHTLNMYVTIVPTKSMECYRFKKHSSMLSVSIPNSDRIVWYGVIFSNFADFFSICS